MNTKELLVACNQMFPISPETTGKEFKGAHSITLRGDVLVLSVWVMTPTGRASFSGELQDGWEQFGPGAVLDNIAQAVARYTATGQQPEFGITLNGDAVKLNSADLTFEKIVELWGGKPGDTPSVTYRYRDTGHAGILMRGQRIEARHGLIVDCYDTSNA